MLMNPNICGYFKKVILIPLTVITILSNTFSQNFSSISGKVIDAKTKEALPGVTIYLASTSIGTVANNDGSFLLNNIHLGKYNLTASMIGYQTFSKPIVFDVNVLSNLTIYLEQKVEELKSVEVTAKRFNNHVDFSEFKRLFLGQTQNASQCKIVNIHDIFVYKKNTQLFAAAHKPIEVENKAMGYRIYYELKDFVIDYVENTAILGGIPRFENLTPKNKNQELRWLEERDRAYYGSELHFFRSLKKKELKKNHFTIYDKNEIEIPEQIMFRDGNDSTIFYKGNLKVVFDGELPESQYPIRHHWQTSTFKFSGNPVTIYANGYYQDSRDVTLLGYVGWANRIADMLPLEYQPTQK